uniref:Cadherin domain-containing protein n=1 Tax=Panagrolaimus sp. PS1159 TaxID=55785 RepID=A0AC35F4V0_9BILA
AYDADSEPFNNVYYYLLPNCNPETDHYEIDLITGEIYELKSNEISRKSGQVLCVLTSSIPDLSSETLRQTDYDKTNSSMTRFAIQTISTMMNEELSNQPQIPVENNTIVVLDSSTSNYQIPFDLTLFNTSESLQFLYKLQNLQFFSFKKDKGISNPNINLFIHRVNDDKKLKFVFDYPLEELGMRIEDFKKSLEEILSANFSGVIRPVFSAPEQYRNKNRRRSAVCFHLAKPNELISLNDSIKLTATKMNSNEKLMSLYQQFEVINIDSCKSEIHLSTTAAASTFSTNTILIVSGILIAILLLFSCIAYTCFVTRYREFLKKQNQKLRDSKPPIEPFSIPQFIDHRRI